MLEAAFEGLAAPRVAFDETPPLASDIDVDDPVAIDQAIVDIAGRLRARDLEIGRLAREVQDAGGWRALGYVNFAHYVRERLGMSLAAVQAKMSLFRTRRCRRSGRGCATGASGR